MMVQQPPMPPTPMPPSIVTGSQSHASGDDDRRENTYSAANSTPARAREEGAAAEQTAPIPERTRHTGDAETEDVQFFTETTQDVHMQTEGIAPPVPQTRGPGHTPRGVRPGRERPPQRPPSRTSSRYGTPRVSRGLNTFTAQPKDTPEAQVIQNSLIPGKPKPSVAQSDRSIAFHVEDETTSMASVEFQVEPSALNRLKSEVDPGTLTNTSDIHFSVVPESQASRADATGAHPAVETSVDPSAITHRSASRVGVKPSQGSHIPAVHDRAGTNSMTSLQFEVESTADNTRHSSISHFTADNNEPEPVPVTNGNGKANDAAAAAAPGQELVTKSEERRRAKRAEEEQCKKALAERSRYMNMRPWDTNAPNPRARRTSSQAVTYDLARQAAEKRESIEKRRQEMYSRPWRTNISTTPRKKRAPTPGTARMPAEEIVGQQKRNGKAKSPPPPPTSSPSSASIASSSPAATPSPSKEPSVQPTPREVVPPIQIPVKPTFDKEEAAKFIRPAPVLKAPLQVIGDEVEAWSETVSQQRNLQAILEMMRARERNCARLCSQIEAQERTMKELNKELYGIRDAFVRKHGTDVTGMSLRARREIEPDNGSAAEPAAQTQPTGWDSMLLRLYPRQRYQARDYVALKRQQNGGPTVSVLSDEDVSDDEKAHFADDLARWRAERHALRKEKARLAHERRDLNFQMRRGSNIKDIKLTQPTSGRGPLERRASGTETMVDIDGYDRLMDMRIAAQKADVEAANAKDQYENLCTVAATMRHQHDNTTELTDAQEMQEKVKEQYEKTLQEMRKQVDAARPLIDKAQALLKKREREALHSDDDNAQAELREYSESILAVRLQMNRAAAMADAAGEDEKRMRRASTPCAGMSRTATPRGSISGSPRLGVSPRGRMNSQPDNDNVFARLADKKSVVAQNGASAVTPKETTTAQA